MRKIITFLALIAISLTACSNNNNQYISIDNFNNTYIVFESKLTNKSVGPSESVYLFNEGEKTNIDVEVLVGYDIGFDRVDNEYILIGTDCNLYFVGENGLNEEKNINYCEYKNGNNMGGADNSVTATKDYYLIEDQIDQYGTTLKVLNRNGDLLAEISPESDDREITLDYAIVDNSIYYVTDNDSSSSDDDIDREAELHKYNIETGDDRIILTDNDIPFYGVAQGFNEAYLLKDAFETGEAYILTEHTTESNIEDSKSINNLYDTSPGIRTFDNEVYLGYYNSKDGGISLINTENSNEVINIEKGNNYIFNLYSYENIYLNDYNDFDNQHVYSYNPHGEKISENTLNIPKSKSETYFEIAVFE